jgi:hypothetical protein
MKILMTLFTVCFLATTLTGCGKELSGTYKHEGSGRIMEFKSSTDFKIRYPDSTVVAGTYEKKDIYELNTEDGSVITFVKKGKNSLIMDDVRYVKQKGKIKISTYLLFIYFFVAFVLIISAICKPNDMLLLILIGILWPIALLFLTFVFLFVILLAIVTRGKMFDVT